jgi:hypothetical protein
MAMPTKLNRLFRLYVTRKKVSSENIGTPAHKDTDGANDPNRPIGRKSSKTSRRGEIRSDEKNEGTVSRPP